MKHFAIILLSILFIAGCCNTKQFTVTEIDTIAIKDTAQLADYDSVWIGPIHADGDSIGSLAVYPKNKKAIVLIKWLKPDTVYFNVPYIPSITNNLEDYLFRLLKIAFIAMPFYYQLLIIILLISTIWLIYFIKSKKK